MTKQSLKALQTLVFDRVIVFSGRMDAPNKCSLLLKTMFKDTTDQQANTKAK